MKAMIDSAFAKICNDVPGVCIVLQTSLAIVISGVLGYLFVTQELMK